jgi:sialate O-acetylesterase
VSVADGKLSGVPTGGPYTIEAGDTKIGPVFVGDLWVLAGQSNMEGYGDLTNVQPPHPLVQSLGMDGKWVQAEEPLHWLVDSPDPVHSGDPATREARSKQQHASRKKGAGLGLPFAVAMVEATDVPVGLIPAAHGGTSMAQWSPALKEQGGASLYGSMMRSVKLAGGKVKGVLWYQGESDANPQAVAVYPEVFAAFIESVRGDLGQPELPFYYVQLSRFVIAGPQPGPWNAVQEAQRLLPRKVPNTAFVAAIDLELDDLIHVGVEGQKRLGRRLANVALHELFSKEKGATQPDLESVTRGEGNTLKVKLRGVNTRKVMGGGNGLEGHAVRGFSVDRHIGGFSLRTREGTEIPLIYDARVEDDQAPDTVTLKLTGPIPAGSFLWYGYGLDPYCNLTDTADMAVPVFGPVPLDDVK